MHYNRPLLVKAGSREEAVAKVEKFLKKQGKEFDFHQIGGRYSWDTRCHAVADIITTQSGSDRVYKHGLSIEDIKAIRGIMGEKFFKTCVPDPISVQYALHRFVDADRTSDVINAQNPDFWKRLEKWAPPSVREEWAKEWSKRAETYPKSPVRAEMVKHYQRKIARLKRPRTWSLDLPFWNTSARSVNYDASAIKRLPNQWWLINLDIHS